MSYFGDGDGIGGAHLVFYNLIAIHHAEKHGKCLSIFTKLREIFYHDNTLAASMVDACSNIYHGQYHTVA